ncbi:MAG: hypothetical protein ACRCWY_09060, partial [Cellulosilyticaceae bacterium]
EEQRAIYEMRAKILKDKNSALNKAKEEGRKEEKLQIAKGLKEAGIDIMVIQATTGLLQEEIEAL